VALPSEDESCVTVRDLRVSPSASPIVQFRGTGQPRIDRNQREHDMVTALAMSEAFATYTSRPIVACGVEIGSVLFHDIMNMPGRSLENTETLCETDIDQYSVQMQSSNVKLGNHPILGLDMAPSSLPPSTSVEGSVVAIAGFAGNAADMLELPESERGTAAVLKAIFSAVQTEGVPMARLRARLPTCTVSDDTAGEPGVAAYCF